MQSKTTRAFRTISEAGDELELQPHVLRFWESKFPQIKPIKRGGGRRFYRPEDIEFLRGIKILLHDEKHPIKDVQKLIRVKGAQRIIELGRSIEKAAKPKEVKETVLIPERIQQVAPKPIGTVMTPAPDEDAVNDRYGADEAHESPIAHTSHNNEARIGGLTDDARQSLEATLARLEALRAQWGSFKTS